MVDRSEIAILGAGFNSIYACYRKLKDGKKVKLFLDGKKFGASMNSIKWKDNTVDLGAHNLDLRTKIAKSFFSEILDDDLLILKKPIFGSLSKNKVTNGIEFANFEIASKLALLAFKDSGALAPTKTCTTLLQ